MEAEGLDLKRSASAQADEFNSRWQRHRNLGHNRVATLQGSNCYAKSFDPFRVGRYSRRRSVGAAHGYLIQPLRGCANKNHE